MGGLKTRSPRPEILGIGTALPRHRVLQSRAAAALAARLPPRARRLAVRVFARAGVRTRYSCLPDFSESAPRAARRVVRAARVSTAERMEIYRFHAPRLAAAAARRALARAGLRPAAVTHLVVATCTGMYAPGPDADLIARLGLRPDVDRAMVGFMGCHGIFHALRIAARAAGGDPKAVVLVVGVELCTIHFRADPSPENVVAHALFGDAAAAAVVGASPAGRAGRATIERAASYVAPGTRDRMTWRVGDEGFRMTLSERVPAMLGRRLAGFVRPLREGGIRSWCVHPGGPAVLAASARALGLTAADLAASRAVLAEIGNVSSPSILFVLERELARMRPGDRGLLLGFGPGLSLEAISFVRGRGRGR